MRSLVSVCITVACLLAASACQGLDFKDEPFECYKLTEKTVTPSKYELDLRFSSLKRDDYKGKVDIDLNIGQPNTEVDSKNTDKLCRTRGALDEIVLHADESLDIRKIRLTEEDQGCIVPWNLCSKSVAIEGLYRDHKKQMIKIKLKRELTANTQPRLQIWFRGRMRTDNLGVYVSQYNDGSKNYKQIVSQFRPAFARTVFPCFDEPQFRVPFKLTLHHPSALTAYSNTNGKYKYKYLNGAAIEFEETPPMPLHMIAFTVGQFDKPLESTITPSYDREDTVKIRVITAPDKRDTGKFALEMARKSLKWFVNYLEIPFPLDKLDIIAVADLDKDNVESWGLAYVRDTKLWIDAETKNDTRITTAINVAHVVVHQWFGNLISVENWRDIWITESVAANMAFKFVDVFYSSDIMFYVRLGILSQVMQADQTGDMHALAPPEEELLTSSGIYGIVDILEFMKSASVGQMLIEYVGEDRYKEWLQKLISDHAFGTIPPGIHKKLLRGQPKFAKTLDSFINNAGVPLVSAEVQDDSILLAAEPYNAAGETFGSANGKSKLVVCPKFVAISDDIGNNDYRNVCAPAETKMGDKFPGYNQFFNFSPDPSIAAYFRTRYSDELFDYLVNAVRHKQLHAMERIQLLEDANNLVQSKLIKRENFAKLVAAHKNQKNFAVLIELLAVNKTLESLGLESPLRQTFMNVFEEYGFTVWDSENHIRQRARQEILKALVAQQEETVVRVAVKAFEQPEGGSVAVFLREPVYAAVVQAGTQKQMQLLFKKLRKTSSYEEKIRLITALAGSKDKKLLTSLQNWLKSSGLKVETIKPFEDSITATLAS